MPKIELITEIYSTVEICFDLATSIDLHKISTAKSNEEAIAGKTSGLIQLHESVTWQATHFGVRQKLTSKITAFDRPNYFKDEQVKGAFKSFYHEHIFKQVEDKVIMKDVFEFITPFGIVGEIFNSFILTAYMQNLLLDRNNVIKEFAETNKWKLVLSEK
jgi:ligand-binding SRPBCC domain-containing protein